MKMNKTKEIIIVSISFSLCLLFFIRELDLSKMWTFADLLPFPNDITHRINEVFYIWSDEGIGGIVSPMTNVIRFQLLVQLIFDAVTSQKISLFLPFLIGFVSQYFFLRNFGLSIYGSYIASFFFVINPHTISYLIIGETGSIMVLAIFPIFIFYLNKYLFENKYTSWNNLSILCILIFLFFWNIYYAIWFSIFSFIFLSLLNIDTLKNEIKKYPIVFIKKISILILIVVLISIPTFVVIKLLMSDVSSPSSSKVMINQSLFDYGDINILNLARLVGDTGSPEIEGYLNYNSFNWFTIFGTILCMIILLSFLIKEMPKFTNLYYSSGILFLIIISIALLIKYNPIIIEKFILFPTLRSPSKLIFPLILFFSNLLAISIDSISNLINRYNYKRVFLVFVIIIIAIYDYPFLDGTMGIKEMTGSVFIPSNYVIGDEYSQLNNFLSSYDKNFSEYNIIFLPWERFSKNKVTRYIPNYLGAAPGSNGFVNQPDGFGNLYDIMGFNPENKAELLSFLNVKYVIVDKKFDTIYFEYRNIRTATTICENLNSCWYIGDPKIFYSMFSTDSNFKLIYETENFTIFDNLILKDQRRVHKENPNIISQNLTFISNYQILENTSFENDLNNFTVIGNYNFSTDSIEGNNSLSLFADNEWWPHIYTNISVNENSIYKLSFYIKCHNITNLHAKLLWYNHTGEIYNDDDSGTDKIDYIRFDDKMQEGKWYHVENILYPPEQSKEVIIVVLGSQAFSNTNKFASAETLVDKFNFIQISGNSNVENYTKEPETKYIKINPTRWNVDVMSDKPFALILNQIYDPLWEATIYKEGKMAEKVNSVPVYFLTNGFLINQTGDLSITLEYKPQKWFEIGNLISIITFAICVGYLLYRKLRFLYI